MSLINLRGFLLPSIVLGGALHADTVLLDHTFDGVANDIGPAFQQVTNLRGGTADTATGVISTGVTQTSSTAGFNNASTLDIPTLDPAAIGFTATFHFSAAPAGVSSLGGNNPHFPALRSRHRLFQRPSPRKQISSSTA